MVDVGAAVVGAVVIGSAVVVGCSVVVGKLSVTGCVVPVGGLFIGIKQGRGMSINYVMGRRVKIFGTGQFSLDVKWK